MFVVVFFCVASFTWKLALDSWHLKAFAGELACGNSRLGTFAWTCSLGKRARPAALAVPSRYGKRALLGKKP